MYKAELKETNVMKRYLKITVCIDYIITTFPCLACACMFEPTHMCVWNSEVDVGCLQQFSTLFLEIASLTELGACQFC